MCIAWKVGAIHLISLEAEDILAAAVVAQVVIEGEYIRQTAPAGVEKHHWIFAAVRQSVDEGTGAAPMSLVVSRYYRLPVG